MSESNSSAADMLFITAGTGNLQRFQQKFEKLVLTETFNYHSLLCVIAAYGHLPILRYLLEDAQILTDLTANENQLLHSTVEDGHLEVLRYLIEESGQTFDLTLEENALLREAARFGHLHLVRYLLEESGQLIDATAQENAALRFAAEEGYLDLAQYLIEDSGQPVNISEVVESTVCRASVSMYFKSVLPFIDHLGISTFQELGKTLVFSLGIDFICKLTADDLQTLKSQFAVNSAFLKLRV
jgi:hypothetical protein